ncbi:aldose epimerase family protein [Mucilaginibacter flavus]|uniref:aldose epimerase family protein n=1 Tax=Mucilaginibacter flavus TaxID=931504 RepID=UPI0025B2D282|nr:aldose epimerase family protein [Mucilaginibacter flavus]MDN3580860.1 aldose epimerase family protein [Mucilaginibacter flavus]
MNNKLNETMIKGQITISQQHWGDHFGKPVYLFRIENTSGAYIEITDYGATLVAAVMPDNAGNFENVILGYDSLVGYVADECYLGATIGRFANRIGGAQFTLDDKAFKLDANDGENSNHGGRSGFNTRVFDHELVEDGITFTLQSMAGDGGFPGNLNLTVTYRFTFYNQLSITYSADTDEATIANFTNHAYFNLSAKDEGVFEHSLKVYADELLDVDAAYIPTGLINAVADKALDGSVLQGKLKFAGDEITGFNDCFLLRDADDNLMKPAARLVHEASGRTLEVSTSYPAVLVYTGDYLHSKSNGSFQRSFKPFDGLCLECQYYPDSPNHAHFPSTTLRPGQAYHQVIVYKFGVII